MPKFMDISMDGRSWPVHSRSDAVATWAGLQFAYSGQLHGHFLVAKRLKLVVAMPNA